MNDTQNQKDIQEITDKLNALVEEAKQLDAKFEEAGRRTEKTLDTIEADVDESVQEIDEITADLDSAEKKAGEEIDKLLINESEEVAAQEEAGDSE